MTEEIRKEFQADGQNHQNIWKNYDRQTYGSWQTCKETNPTPFQQQVKQKHEASTEKTYSAASHAEIQTQENMANGRQ